MERRRSRHCHQATGVALLALLSPAGYAEEYGALPAAPRAIAAVPETTLYLRLVVNGQEDNDIVPVISRQQHFAVPADVLIRNHVRIGEQTRGLINVDTLANVQMEYDAANQLLRLTVPEEWFPQQSIGDSALLPYAIPQSDAGLLLNYDAYYNDPHQGSQTLTTWLEQRLFNSAGMLSNTGTYRTSTGSGGSKGYLRYDTSWRYSDEKNRVSWQIGDFVSDALTWNNAMRMGGLRVSRNFGIRPDLVTYPLMQYSGTAAVPGTVDLFINGYKSSTSEVNAGPFTLTNVPYINGAGEATVVTADALGRQVTTSVPFYVSNTLLQQGLSDFDFSAGALRKKYGIAGANYADSAFSGFYRYGISNWLTLASHAEAMRGMASGGLGADAGVGYWGTLSTSYSQSQSRKKGSAESIDSQHGRGSQYTVGYSYYSTLFSLNAQHAARSRSYQDLSVHSAGGRLSKQSDQVTFSTTPFGNHSGTMGLGYFDIRARDGSRTRLGNLSYSQSIWGGASLYLSLNKTFNERGYSSQLQLMLPFSNGTTSTASLEKNNRGRYQERVTLNRSVPVDGGVGWNLSWGEGTSQYRQADATWKTQLLTLQGGVWGEPGRYSKWADVSGSVIYMDSSLFAANRINDAFIVVSTDRYAGIPVKYENQRIGKTNRNGHILVPWASAWYPSKLEIDALDLPVNAEVTEVEKRVTVREGSGALVKFTVQIVREATITLVDNQNRPLPVGTPVTELQSGQQAIVGYGGQVWFSHLQKDSVLMIYPQGAQACRHALSLPEDNQTAFRAGPFVCPTISSMPGEAEK